MVAAKQSKRNSVACQLKIRRVMQDFEMTYEENVQPPGVDDLTTEGAQ